MELQIRIKKETAAEKWRAYYKITSFIHATKEEQLSALK